MALLQTIKAQTLKNIEETVVHFLLPILLGEAGAGLDAYSHTSDYHAAALAAYAAALALVVNTLRQALAGVQAPVAADTSTVTAPLITTGTQIIKVPVQMPLPVDAPVAVTATATNAPPQPPVGP